MIDISYTRTFARKNRNDGGGELFLGCGKRPRWISLASSLRAPDPPVAA